MRLGKVRRAKLYYLRDRVGKKTRVKELVGDKVRRDRDSEKARRAAALVVLERARLRVPREARGGGQLVEREGLALLGAAARRVARVGGGQGARPAAAIAVDPSGIALSDLEALESTHRSLQGSLRKMDRATAVGWAGVAGCIIGVVTWFDGALAGTHVDNDGQVRAGAAIAVGGAVTMIVASAVKSRTMGDIRDLKESIRTKALGIPKPTNRGKQGGRTRF